MSEPKTVRVRVAVAVDPSGKWNAFGYSEQVADEAPELAAEHVEEGERVYWLTADLPIPTVAEVTAEVEESK